MIALFIPSFDRACQARLLLESIQHLPEGLVNEIHFYYDVSSPEYERGYEKLVGEGWPGVIFRKGGGMRERLLTFLDAHRSQYAAIVTDDSIFYRKVDRFSLHEAFADPQIISFCFRLGLNTNVVCQVKGEKQEKIDELRESPPFITWNWKNSTQHFRHPFALDGNAYRAEDLRSATLACGFNSLTAWECHTNDAYRGGGSRLRCAALARSCLVNVPANHAEHSHSAYGVLHPFAKAELNARYLDGEVIDLENTDFSGVNACQMEIPYQFKRLA